MEMLKDHIRTGLLALVPEQHLLDVGCEMLEAGDNAIIYEVEADLDGVVAPMMEDVERELTRLCVDACNKFNSWPLITWSFTRADLGVELTFASER